MAAVLGTATSTAYQLCATGKLRHCRVSNAIRFAPMEIAEFVRRRRSGAGT
ncbi:MAG: helix-turn-helix domain-containing protein [Deltaproteobacteria bacterium]|nr:helix-turn-helix domain-containing protein [Deltaproteobacteria bacterium]